MVDIAAVVGTFPGVRPMPGLGDCWTWSAGRFHFTLALAADGAHALQLNCRDEMDTDLVVDTLAFARDRTAAVVAAAPFAVLEGFTAPHPQTPFDTVAAALPGVHRLHKPKQPALHNVTFAVFPAYRCEFSGMETQREATYRFDRMFDAANLRRLPSPWVRMRFDNPKTAAGSVGPDLGIASVNTLMQELRNLDGADDAFVEFENFRAQVRRASWSGELTLTNGDETRAVDLADLLAFAHQFVYEGTDHAA